MMPAGFMAHVATTGPLMQIMAGKSHDRRLYLATSGLLIGLFGGIIMINVAARRAGPD